MSARLTEAEFEALKKKRAMVKTIDRQAAFHAIGRLPKDKMNKTERSYADLLDQRRLAGDILDWKFHAMNVRLADNTFYETDFLVVAADRELQIHEVKGTHITDKGKIKIKLCGQALPWFRCILAIKEGATFTLSEISGGGLHETGL